MNYLLVVAHPDDEVLGAGATIHKLIQEGHRVDLCILSAEAAARSISHCCADLASDLDNVVKTLGIKRLYKGTFPNIEMNTVPHLELVKFIEAAIIDAAPDVVITHHPADTNDDHVHTSKACQAAVRIFQRRNGVKPIAEVWYMEVLSSTEWSLDNTHMFAPNVFVEIGEEGVAQKLATLQQYHGVMRDYPHPRSTECIKGLAAYRGAQAGCCYAEAFQCVFRRICK